MIYGDSGTGKDIVAREIHRNSKYNKGPFIAINAALMEQKILKKNSLDIMKMKSVRLDI